MDESKLESLLKAYVQRWENALVDGPPSLRDEFIPSLGSPPNSTDDVDRLQQRLGLDLPSDLTLYLVGPRVDVELQGAGLTIPGNVDLEAWELQPRNESFNALGFAQCGWNNMGDHVLLDLRARSSGDCCQVLIAAHDVIFEEHTVENATVARFRSFEELLETVCLDRDFRYE